MVQAHHDLGSALADVTETPLGDLAELDDSLLENTVVRLLPRCGGVAGLVWQNGGKQRQDYQPAT
jgi:FXSXX-COOH protein